jgi:hypothetical protein
MSGYISPILASWTELLSGIRSEQRFLVLIIALGCLLALVLGLAGIVSSTVNSIQRRRAEMDLKREMIDRGMSADDIAKVIEAASPPEDATQRWIASWAKKRSAKPPC